VASSRTSRSWGVDRVARGERTVEFEVADQVAEVGLGELGERHEEVGHVVHEPLRVGGFVVHDGVDRHHHVVGGDDLLRGHVDHLLAHVDELHRLDERQDQVEARVTRGLVLAETFDEPPLVWPHDLDRADQHADADECDDDQDDGDGVHGASRAVGCLGGRGWW
jgi:hypothetical protein